MKYTIKQLEKMMEENGGGLDLRETQIKELPEGLTVGDTFRRFFEERCDTV